MSAWVNNLHCHLWKELQVYIFTWYFSFKQQQNYKFKSAKVPRKIMKPDFPGKLHIYTLRIYFLQSLGKFCAAVSEELHLQKTPECL